MNRSNAAMIVNLRISARGGRLDPSVVSRMTQAVVGALLPDPSPTRPPATAAALQHSHAPGETAA